MISWYIESALLKLLSPAHCTCGTHMESSLSIYMGKQPQVDLNWTAACRCPRDRRLGTSTRPSSNPRMTRHMFAGMWNWPGEMLWDIGLYNWLKHMFGLIPGLFGNETASGNNGLKTHVDGDHWTPSGYLSKYNLWHECLHLAWETVINYSVVMIKKADPLPNFVVVEIVTRLLSQWDWDKLAAIFCRRHTQTHFREWTCCILTKISLKFVPQCPVHIIPHWFR